ncbi:MAG: AAA family ATPase [Nitriliruptorales bacterium]|nr:AAA family ATPase [Nitriliruptorales bacterium]
MALSSNRRHTFCGMTGGTRVSSPHFVGRREELARLEVLLDSVRTGAGATVLLAGAAGIGKTRTTEELAQRAAALGARVLRGGCVDLDGDVMPYAPFVEMLRSLTRSEGVAMVLELAGPTGDELARLDPSLLVGGGVPEASRASASRLYLALTSLLSGLAQRAPLVVVTEDIHWADSCTRDVLALVVRALPPRVLLLMTMRDDEVPEGDAVFRRFRSQLERSGAHRLDLRPLSRDDQARQISGIVGLPPPRALLDRVYGRADGNPFFAEELLALGDSPDGVPAGVRDLLLARVEALPRDTQRVLRAAAAAGRRVPHRLLAGVCDLEDEALDDALRHAVMHHILVPLSMPVASYQHRHALLREVIADTLLPAESARLHRRLAQTLTADPALGADGAHGVMGRIAHHWHAAGDPDQILVSSVAAGQESERALAFGAALAHYERAIPLVDTVPDADRLVTVPRYRLLWSAAQAAHHAAHPDRAAALIRSAIAACDPEVPIPGDPLMKRLHYAYLHERLGRYLWMSADGQGAMAAYERAVELAPPEPTCWRAATVSGYSQMLMLASRFKEAIPRAEEAITIARSLDNARSTEGHALNNLGVSLAILGDVDTGIEHLLAARTIAEEEFDDVARAIVNLHSVLFDLGRIEEAAAVAIEGIAVTTALGLERRKGVWCRCDAAGALVLLGRCDEARRLLGEALELDPDGIDAVRTHLVFGVLSLQQGDLTAAQRHLDEAHASAGRLVDGQLNGPLFAALVELTACRGDSAAALALAEEGLSRLLPDEDAAYGVPVHAAAATAAADARDAEHVRIWVDRAETAVAADAAHKPAPAAHLLAMRAELQRARGAAAPDAWAEAAAAWERLGVPYRAAYAWWREAEACLAAGSARDAAAAAARAGLETASRIGAQRLVEQLESLVARARLRVVGSSRTERAAPDPFRLTPRERDVLALLAEGRTDRQIGHALFISHRTVERHVSNILAKLGADTRVGAAVMAHAAAPADIGAR